MTDPILASAIVNLTKAIRDLTDRLDTLPVLGDEITEGERGARRHRPASPTSQAVTEKEGNV